MVGKLTNGGWEGSLQRRCKTKLHCIGHFSSVWGNSLVLIVALIFSTSFFITHSYSLSFPLTISPTVGWLLRVVRRVRCTNTVRANTVFAAASLTTTSTPHTWMQMNYFWTNMYITITGRITWSASPRAEAHDCVSDVWLLQPPTAAPLPLIDRTPYRVLVHATWQFNRKDKT